jgi:WD40 repeat protein
VTLAEQPKFQAAQDQGGPLLMLDTGGHMAIIKGLAFTPDGKQLVSASDDKVIRVWDWQAGKTIRTIRGQVGPGAPRGRSRGNSQAMAARRRAGKLRSEPGRVAVSSRRSR